MKKSELRQMIREELLKESYIAISGNKYNEKKLMEFIENIYHDSYDEVVVNDDGSTDITGFNRWYSDNKKRIYKMLKDITT